MRIQCLYDLYTFNVCAAPTVYSHKLLFIRTHITAHTYRNDIRVHYTLLYIHLVKEITAYKEKSRNIYNVRERATR